MFSVFNYSTLKVTLEKSTRSLRVILNRPENQNAINLEMLFELESLFAWTSNKVEIQSILVSSETDDFSCGFEESTLSKLSQKQITKVTKKLQKIIQAMHYLPQTIIVDLKNGAQNLACELALGADLRIANTAGKISFNHSQLGIAPGSGGMGVLTLLLGPSIAKNLLLSGKAIPVHKLVQCGFIFDLYDSTNRDETIDDLLTSIRHQAPVQRIQSKLGILEPIRSDIEKAMKSDAQISKAALISEDWKKDMDNSFMPAKSMSYSVKLSLLKNDETPEITN